MVFQMAAEEGLQKLFRKRVDEGVGDPLPLLILALSDYVLGIEVHPVGKFNEEIETRSARHVLLDQFAHPREVLNNLIRPVLGAAHLKRALRISQHQSSPRT